MNGLLESVVAPPYQVSISPVFTSSRPIMLKPAPTGPEKRRARVGSIIPIQIWR